MSIKSGPNLYQPRSLYKRPLYNRKYGLADYKFYFHEGSHPQKYNQGICSSARKFFIKEASCKLEARFSYNVHTLKFISQAPNLQHLSITFGPFSIEKGTTFKEVKTMLKRTLIRNKRISHLSIEFNKKGQVHPLILRNITLLSSIKSLKFILPEAFPPTLETLSTFLSQNHQRKVWPLLKSQLLDLYLGLNLPSSLSLDDSITLVVQSLIDLNREMTSMRGVQTQYRLAFQLLRISDTERIQTLIDAIAAFPILTYMKFNITSRLDVFRLFEGLRDSRYLREVTFMCFESLGAQSTTLSSLVNGLAHLRALTTLSVMIEAYKKASDIHTFAESLPILENLKDLSLTIMDPEYVDDYFMDLLGESLTRLPRLESLDIDFERYILLQETTLSPLTVQAFFERIGQIVTLQSLSLNFKNFEGLITEDEIFILSSSLKQLDNFKEFQLDISNSPVKAKAMLSLFQELSRKTELTQLEVFCKDCESLDMEILEQIFHGLSKLRHLTVLNLNFPCAVVNSSLNIMLTQALFSLKSLKKVGLVLWVDIQDLEKMEAVEKNMQQLKGRMEIEFKYF